MSAASAATVSRDQFPLAPELSTDEIYYFALVDVGQDNIERLPFSSLAAARAHGARRAHEILWQCPYRLHAQPEWTVRVTNESGRVLVEIPLSAALD